MQVVAKISPTGKLVGPFFEGILCNFFKEKLCQRKQKERFPKA
jgi:hypothetical protein